MYTLMLGEQRIMERRGEGKHSRRHNDFYCFLFFKKLFPSTFLFEHVLETVQ